MGAVLFAIIHQGPVIQSVISLTSLLRVISLTVLADSIYNILIFFAEKMCVAFALHSICFSIQFQHICISLYVNFNESLTNDIVSFEQLGPDLQTTVPGKCLWLFQEDPPSLGDDAVGKFQFST